MIVGDVLTVECDHLPRQLDELLAAASGCPLALRDLDQLADHVTPANLLLQNIEEVVGGVADGDRKAAEVLPDQILSGLLATGGIDPVARYQGRGGDPQPPGRA